MLLAIDVGNTNVVFALYQGDEIKGMWRTTTNVQRTSDDYAVFLTSLMNAAGLGPGEVTRAILGSVVPDANFQLVKLCRDHFGCEPVVVGAFGDKVGLQILIDRPEDLGADRLLNALAARASYQTPLLVVDFGTATTLDVVDEKGAYRGGAIAPGINLSIRALHMAAAKLPSVAVARPAKVIGTNTVEAIQSGIYWGYVGLIGGLIDRTKAEFGAPMTVIATGGLAALFVSALPAIDHVDRELTLRGLCLMDKILNQKKE